jgi:hypothetical protein
MRAVLLPRPKRRVQSSLHLDALEVLALLMEFSCRCRCCECLTVVIIVGTSAILSSPNRICKMSDNKDLTSPTSTYALKLSPIPRGKQAQFISPQSFVLELHPSSSSLCDHTSQEERSSKPPLQPIKNVALCL